jgi:signal transduction histidine kinase
VALEVRGDDEAPLDPGRVEQVVSNLVANALAHGEAGTPVAVTVRGEAEALWLEVASRGATIPPHRLPTLFEPFHPSDAPGGLGLGLFIVDQVARAHGGSAAVRSQEGETTFTVAFPRSAATAEREPVSADPAA